MKRRTLIGGAAGWALASTVSAQARTVALLSLAADDLTVTGFETTTGSALHNNPKERIALPPGELDRYILRAAMRALAQSGGGRGVPLLMTDPDLFRAQGRFVGEATAALPANVIAILQEQKATHLLLATKHEGPARMQLADGATGTGRVSGLGFYVDRVTATRLSGTSERAVGYIAPYVYLRLSLIDVASGAIARSRVVTASRVYTPSTQNPSADPWELLDPRAKLQALRELIDTQVESTLREVLAP